MLAVLLHFLRWVKYRRAAFVTNREELERALRAAPPRIVVEGNEALRAYAASLAYRGGAEAAELEAATPVGAAPSYMVVPTVGRIRDGYRGKRRKKVQQPRFGLRLRAGMGTIVVAAVGISAALLVELLSIPAGDPELVRGPQNAGVQIIRRHHMEAKLPTRAPPPAPPTLAHRFEQGAILILGTIAILALAQLLWEVMANRRMRVSWRVERRVQGRLVIARVRTRVA